MGIRAALEAGKYWFDPSRPDQFKEFMDLGTQRTGISETAVMLDLISRGYDVFMQTTGKSCIDLVGHKDGKLFRVQVKSCWKVGTNNSYRVMLRSTRVNATSVTKKGFDPNSCDILAIYLGDGTIQYLDPQLVGTRNEIAIKSGIDHKLKLTF